MTEKVVNGQDFEFKNQNPHRHVGDERFRSPKLSKSEIHSINKSKKFNSQKAISRRIFQNVGMGLMFLGMWLAGGAVDLGGPFLPGALIFAVGVIGIKKGGLLE